MSPSPDHGVSKAPRQTIGAESDKFSAEERRLLLQLAHQSIHSSLRHYKLSLTPPSAHLAEPRGAFTTIYLGGELRGCVGYVFPSESLYQTIIDTARAAAFDDARFSPITEAEAPEVKVSLSILSTVFPVQPEEIEVGRHGLIVSQFGQRGLLLPQVPVEHHWDALQFLEQTCRKAGLPLDAWREGATLEAFTAEVFGDEDVLEA